MTNFVHLSLAAYLLYNLSARFQNLGEMMTLGRNDAAVSPTFIEGLTLEGPLGHTGNILWSRCTLSHWLWFPFFLPNNYNYKNKSSSDLLALACFLILTTMYHPFFAARKLAYLLRLPTDEHRLKVGVSWLTKAAVDTVASVQDTLSKAIFGS